MFGASLGENLELYGPYCRQCHGARSSRALVPGDRGELREVFHRFHETRVLEDNNRVILEFKSHNGLRQRKSHFMENTSEYREAGVKRIKWNVRMNWTEPMALPAQSVDCTPFFGFLLSSPIAKSQDPSMNSPTISEQGPLPEMEGSSASSSSTGEGGSDASFPMIVSFWPLHCYYDRLGRKLEDPVLLGIDEDVRVQVRRLKNNQDAVEEWVETILRDMFGASLIENLEVVAGTEDDVAALNLLQGSFSEIEDSIEKKIVQIAQNLVLEGKVSLSDVEHLIVSQHPVRDADGVPVSLPEDAGNLGTASSSSAGGSSGGETISRGQDVITRLLTVIRRVSSSSGSDEDNDGRVSSVEVLSDISKAMEELKEILHQEMGGQDAAPNPESCTDNPEAVRITGKALMDDLNNEIDSDAVDLRRRPRIQRVMPGLDEKFERSHEIEVASSEPCPQGGGTMETILQRIKKWKDYEPVRQIMRRADIIEDQLGPTFVNLFLLLKRHDHEVFKIVQFKMGLERTCSVGDTRVVKKIASHLQIVDEELDMVRKDWTEEGVQSVKKESLLVDELLNKFMKVALKLEALRNYLELPNPQAPGAEEISQLDRRLVEAELDFEEIDMKMDELQTRLKYGKFAGLIIALANAVCRCVGL
ncbi:hypothetical protein MLD38_010321 [Melastoma candidum]|uniref:Uncharacterized protein n=1 Tax=Melastoma candidum TaxID=119954 RepID=A0ACB9R2Z6_9MYRT|nr:hypothetical protein MLD38_010321 [Melastoma candidum]